MNRFFVLIFFGLLSACTSPNTFVTDQWAGNWTGPEGTSLTITGTGGAYGIAIQSLDGLETYPGYGEKDRITFTRNGKAETITAGTGKDTGMKWLLDKQNCLVIKLYEGFCRDR